ncbi:hypothetical protein CKA32_004251 [Geitlerinema sp. FC II]|uniref:hypothetical protein n=1 Tax=Baaleninema simplex TaxID=2862350 RepID=UPI0003463246|nr:hypothetical protein [Baaleninema simplex]MDC0832734.1 hypothetical protein [Geitlerinema sp. CS-897]PPT06566.1 hypothetical protein CKA32_004251 [Geitlerinema sp. FC II]
MRSSFAKRKYCDVRANDNAIAAVETDIPTRRHSDSEGGLHLNRTASGTLKKF